MLEISNKTKNKLSKRDIFLFRKATKIVLGDKYELSLVFCTDKISKHNTLAYPLSESEGEIIINPSRLGKFSLIQLFIHSLAHLAKFKHGKTMDNFEAEIHRELLTKF
ncbi:MAG TPA: hypothetical protein VJK09_03460 [Candidatus Paceibacterota bacterium]